MKKAFHLLVFALILILSRPVAGDCFQLLKTDSGLDLRWNGTQTSFMVNISAAPAGAVQAIQNALQTWTAVGKAAFRFSFNGTSGIPCDGDSPDDINVVCFSPSTTADSGDILAVTNTWYIPATGEITDADIQFNTLFPFATSGAPGVYDLQDVATHELGHALGLDDLYGPADTTKTMYGYTSTGETSQRVLSPDDMNGSTFLYPAISLSLPSSGNFFQYPPSLDPVLDANPSNNRPLAVGDVAVSSLPDKTVALHVSFLPFTGPADIYIGIYAPAIAPDLYLIGSNGGLYPVSAGLTKWRASTRGQIDEMLSGEIPAASLAPGTYYLYVALTPAGSTSASYIWSTSFTID